jgi:hypothetical protein
VKTGEETVTIESATHYSAATRALASAAKAPGDPGPAVLDSASEVTRLLCAGVYLDDDYRANVLRVLTKDTVRYAAPAYGYDSARVVAHAQAYRERRIVVRILIAGLALITILMATVGGEALFVTFLCAVWLSWVAVFFERLFVHNVLTRHLRKPTPAGAGSTPVPLPPNSNLSASRPAPKQDASAHLVYYSGYKPFVGAGEATTLWAFPILLVPRQDPSLTELLSPSSPSSPADASPDEDPVPVPEVTVAELLSYVERRLAGVLRTELQDAHRIDQLEITRRWYRTAVAEARPVSPDRVDLPKLAARQGQEEYGSPREYLCVHIGSWKQELVTSAFLGFDIKGQTLHTEFHAAQLKPIKPAFHQVDFYPREIGAGRVLRIAAESAVHMVAAVFLLPMGIISALPGRKTGGSGLEPGEEENDQSGGFKDYGARESIRELAAHTKYHHYFQEIDSKKYISIVERWVDQITLEYLDRKGVDLAEFRSKRAVTLVNTGYLQTGGELNVDGMAVGQDATVTVNAPRDAYGDESASEYEGEEEETVSFFSDGEAIPQPESES